MGASLLRFLDHTLSNINTRYDSSKEMICLLQSPLPTQNTTYTGGYSNYISVFVVLYFIISNFT